MKKLLKVIGVTIAVLVVSVSIVGLTVGLGMTYDKHQVKVKTQQVENKRLESAHERELEGQIAELKERIRLEEADFDEAVKLYTNHMTEMANQYQTNIANLQARINNSQVMPQQPIQVEIVPSAAEERWNRYNRGNPYRAVGGMF
jgi:predicted PurR-regulated permease PerM